MLTYYVSRSPNATAKNFIKDDDESMDSYLESLEDIFDNCFDVSLPLDTIVYTLS